MKTNSNSTPEDQRNIYSKEEWNKLVQESIDPTSWDDGSDPAKKSIADWLEALVYYSQIHTVTGVRAAGMLSHEDAWRKAQQYLWDNFEVTHHGYAPKKRERTYTQSEVDDLLDRERAVATNDTLKSTHNKHLFGYTQGDVKDKIDKVLRDFRRDELPFGKYPDYVLIEFSEKWLKENLK